MPSANSVRVKISKFWLIGVLMFSSQISAFTAMFWNQRFLSQQRITLLQDQLPSF